MQQQQQQQAQAVQLEGEVQYNEVLIEERDEAIQEISHQIGEVHEIFQAGHRRRRPPHLTATSSAMTRTSWRTTPGFLISCIRGEALFMSWDHGGAACGAGWKPGWLSENTAP